MTDVETIARFDATIDLTDAIVPAGMQAHEAVRRVRAAVEGVPGAGWIVVDWLGIVPELPWLRLYEPGNSKARTDGAWAGLAGVVKAVAVRALAV